MKLQFSGIPWWGWLFFGVFAPVLWPLFAPKTQRPGAAAQEAAAPNQLEVTTSTEDRIIPEVFGMYKVAPNLIHMGEVRHEPIVQVSTVESAGGGKGGGRTETVEQVVGYATFATFLMAICGESDCLRGFYFNDKLVWFDDVDPKEDGETQSLKTGVSAQTNGSGYNSSDVMYRDGSQVGFSEYVAALGHLVPYHGTSLLWFDDAFVGDNASGLPNYAAMVRRIVDVVDPGGGKATVAGDGQNPADLLWYILTVMLGVTENQLDSTSFETAQATLYTEQLALYVLLESPTKASDLIDEVLHHIDGMLFMSASTGLWTLSLIRDDYDEGTLPVLTTDHWTELEVERQGWEDLPSIVEFSHLSLDTWDMVSRHLHNPAAEYARGSQKRVKDAYPYFLTQAAVEWAGTKALNRFFKPAATVKFKLPPAMTHPDTGVPWLPQEGDVVKVRWPNPLLPSEAPVDLIIRVTSVTRGARERSVTIDGMEDVFGDGGADTFTPPDYDGSGEDYNLDTEPRAVFVADLPRVYYTTSPGLAVLCDVADDGTSQENFLARMDGYTWGPFPASYTAQLNADIPADGPWIDEATSYALTSATSRLEAFTSTSGAFQRLAHVIVVEDGTGDYEIMGVKTLALTPSLQMTGLIRDLAGTGRNDDGSMKSWSAGATVWFMDGPTFRARLPLAGNLGTERTVECVGINFFSASQPNSETHTYGYTAETPWPVDHLAGEKIGSGASQTHRLTWTARLRHDGATQSNCDDWTAYDVDPEGKFVIDVPADSGFDPITVSGATTYDITNAGAAEVTYRVRSYLSGRYGADREVTVPAD